MQDNKILRIWQWSVILLVLCNIGLILTIWLKPHRDGGHGRAARDYVIASLKFSDAQVKEYDVLIQDHQSAMRQLQKEAMALRQQLFSGLKTDSPATATADSLAALIANNQKQIELVTFHHFEQVRKICTAAQKTEFDNIIGDVMKKMNGPGHGGPPGRPGSDGPPDGGGPPPPDGQGPPPDGQGPPPGGEGR